MEDWRAASVSPLVFRWWLLFLLMNFTASLVARRGIGVFGFLLLYTVEALAAVATFLLVRQVSDQQMVAVRGAVEAAAAPVPAS